MPTEFRNVLCLIWGDIYHIIWDVTFPIKAWGFRFYTSIQCCINGNFTYSQSLRLHLRYISMHYKNKTFFQFDIISVTLYFEQSDNLCTMPGWHHVPKFQTRQGLNKIQISLSRCSTYCPPEDHYFGTFKLRVIKKSFDTKLIM